MQDDVKKTSEDNPDAVPLPPFLSREKWFIVKQLKRLPLVGRYWHVVNVISFYGLFSMLGSAVQYLVIFPIVKNQLGSSDFGSFSLALSFVSPFLVVAVEGQVSTVFRHYSWRPTPEEKSDLLATGFWFTVVLGTVLSAALFLATFFMADLFGSPTVVAMSRWLVPTVLTTALVRYLGVALRADLQIVLASALTNVQSVLAVAMILCILFMGPLGAPAGMFIAVTLTAAIMIVVVARKGIIRRWRVWKKSDSRVFLTAGPIFVVAGISSIVLASMGRWFVGYYIPEKDAITHFTVASYMVQMSIMPLEVAGYALVPLICAKAKVADFSRKTRIYYLLSGLALMPLIFAVGWYVGRPLMLLYKQDVYDAAVPLLLVMLIGRAMFVFQILSSGFFYKFWKPMTMLYLNGSAVALGVFLNIWLVPKFYAQGQGALGAAWAMGLAIGFQGGVCAVLLAWKLLQRYPDGQPPQCPTTGDIVEQEAESQRDILH